jgi:hypothetical protein
VAFSHSGVGGFVAVYGLAALLAPQSPSITSPTESRFALLGAIDRDGMPVLGLSEDEVVVEENGKSREILNVSPAAYPVAIILDTSSYARAGFQELRTAARKLANALSGRDVALYTAAVPAACVADFTRDTTQIDAALDQAFARPNGIPDTVMAIAEAARNLRERKASVTRIVVLSAGGPERGTVAPREVLRDVVAGRSIVDIVDMREIRTDRRVTNTGGSTVASGPRSALGDEELLRGLAERTRGHYQRIFDPGGYASALDLVRREIVSEVIVDSVVRPFSTAINRSR